LIFRADPLPYEDFHSTPSQGHRDENWVVAVPPGNGSGRIFSVDAPVPGAKRDGSVYLQRFFRYPRHGFLGRRQYTFNEAHLDNFKRGDKDIIDGRLIISTRPGGFSKAGLSARYKLQGDFDIQVD
jgi:hypothetical protein